MQKTITTILSKFDIEEKYTIIDNHTWLEEMVVRGFLLRSIIAAELVHNEPIAQIVKEYGWSVVHNEHWAESYHRLPVKDGAEVYLELTDSGMYFIEYREKSKNKLRFSCERFADPVLRCPVMNILDKNLGLEYIRGKDIDDFLLVPAHLDIFAREILKKHGQTNQIDYEDRGYLESLLCDDPVTELVRLHEKPYFYIDQETASALIENTSKCRLGGGLHDGMVCVTPTGLEFSTYKPNNTYAKYGKHDTYPDLTAMRKSVLTSMMNPSRMVKGLNFQQRGLTAVFAMYGIETDVASLTDSYRMLFIMRYGCFPEFIRHLHEESTAFLTHDFQPWDDIIHRVLVRYPETIKWQ